jgi:hypothetical protein
MSKNTFWILVLLFVAVLAGWYVWAKDQGGMVTTQPSGTVTPTDTMSPTPTVAPKTIDLDQQGASGQNGTVTFEASGDSTKVTIAMVGKKYTSPQPAHIHVGECPKPGDVKFPLNNVVDGKSETVVAVKFEDLFTTLLPLAVNVHKSAEEAAVYTACGDLF